MMLVYGALGGSTADAQSVHRDSYYSSLPPTPPIISQTDASSRLHLFGDPADAAYSDAVPRDGIDDLRGRRLSQLAEHFSPILRRNTLMVPREFEDVLDERVQLNLDVWLDHVRIDSTVIDLGSRLEPTYLQTTPEGELPPDTGAAGDSQLRELLHNLSPRRLRPPISRAPPTADTILYIDIPGEDDFSWRPSHGRRLPERSRIYAHPFIHEVAGITSERRFEFLIQFWFFYPYNDAANNHEGDWEHITVSVTTLERARDGPRDPSRRGLLGEAEISALLDPVSPAPLDSLRIRSVAYYFHNNVMVLDYLAIAAGGTMRKGVDASDGSIHIWEDTRYMDNAVLRRISEAEGRLATHPIGYIGGNSKGMDELLQIWPRFLGSYNRDSHGTYPFPGVWRKVGPLDATEKIFGDVMPRLRVDRNGRTDPSAAWYELLDDERYLVYREDDIILLPDWERLEPLVLEDPAARRRWAWFILPLHMGFPASRSPGAGTLKRVDLGNVAPMSPAYNTAWNRPGATAVYPLYEPTVLRVVLAPISPLASLQSGWGVFNIPIVLWGLLPGGNVAVTQLLPWITGGMHLLGSPPPKTFYLGELPERLTSMSGGGFHHFGGDDFARLLPDPEHPVISDFLVRHAAEGAAVGDGKRVPARGSRIWLNLHYSSRLSIENSFGYGITKVFYPIQDADQRTLADVQGTLYTRELTGGITYRLPPLSSEALRLYARGGYGWTSYSLRDVAISGQPIEGTDLRGGRLPRLWPSLSWWPNTTYAGIGAEMFATPRFWLFDRVGYGVRVEVTGLLHRLEAGDACDDCRVTAERGDAAVMLLFGW